MTPSTPVVLLHGLATSSARTWGENGWLDLLADAGREAVPIDILGHGTAERPHDPAAYADLEGYVADRLPDGPVDAVGFSLGARLLLGLAIDRPDRFRRIVTLGVGRNLFENSGSDAIVAALEAGGDPTNPVAAYFARLADHPDADRGALIACLQAPLRLLTAEACAKVSASVLVVIGARDFAGPGDPLVDALPDARLVVLPGADHFSTPKDFGAIDATLRFLEG
ncbi:MAG TPA: alpha/beta hydrolase [Acidimicrobiia bacterium]|nr:alpha/beta hydrolase [Acidimicrobiia bacterium]HKN91151.1 alpha/beta hydrolase [Acidimicrobiia bacterium]